MVAGFKKYYAVAVCVISVLPGCIAGCKNGGGDNKSFAADTAQVSNWIKAGDNAKFNLQGDGKKVDSIAALYKKAIKLSEQATYYQGITLGYISLGILESKLFNYEVSRSYFDSALAVAAQYRDDSFSGRIYREIARTYLMQEDFEEGATWLLNGIVLLEKSIPERDIAGSGKNANLHYLMSAYDELAGVFMQLEQFDKTLYYDRKCIALARSKQDYGALARSLGNISLVYATTDSFSQAEATAAEGLALARKYQFGRFEVLCLLRLGELFVKTDTSKALPYLQDALAISRKHASSADEMLLQHEITILYIKEHKYGLAEKIAGETDTIASKLHDKLLMHDVDLLLSQIYYGQKKYKEAYEKHTGWAEKNDSLEKAENKNKIRLLEIRYSTAEKDKSIAESKVQIARQNEKLVKKNLLLLGGAGLMVLVVAFFILLYRNRQRVQAEKLKAFKKEEKVNMLLSVMKGEEKERSRLANELHDGIGGLLSTVKMYFSNIQNKEPSLIISPEYKEAMLLLEQTLAELRKTAHNLMPDVLLKNELPEALRQLCTTIQNANSIKVSFQYYGFVGRLNNNFELFIYRIIQELLQNIVKHAYASEALVQISIHNDVFSITVEDNGVGIKTGIGAREGMGLKTIRNRVEEINGHFMVSSGKQNGTSVYIEIDIKNNEKFDLFNATLLSGIKLSQE